MSSRLRLGREQLTQLATETADLNKAPTLLRLMTSSIDLVDEFKVEEDTPSLGGGAGTGKRNSELISAPPPDTLPPPPSKPPPTVDDAKVVTAASSAPVIVPPDTPALRSAGTGGSQKIHVKMQHSSPAVVSDTSSLTGGNTLGAADTDSPPARRRTITHAAPLHPPPPSMPPPGMEPPGFSRASWATTAEKLRQPALDKGIKLEPPPGRIVDDITSQQPLSQQDTTTNPLEALNPLAALSKEVDLAEKHATTASAAKARRLRAMRKRRNKQMAAHAERTTSDAITTATDNIATAAATAMTSTNNASAPTDASPSSAMATTTPSAPRRTSLISLQDSINQATLRNREIKDREDALERKQRGIEAREQVLNLEWRRLREERRQMVEAQAQLQATTRPTDVPQAQPDSAAFLRAEDSVATTDSLSAARDLLLSTPAKSLSGLLHADVRSSDGNGGGVGDDHDFQRTLLDLPTPADHRTSRDDPDHDNHTRCGYRLGSSSPSRARMDIVIQDCERAGRVQEQLLQELTRMLSTLEASTRLGSVTESTCSSPSSADAWTVSHAQSTAAPATVREVQHAACVPLSQPQQKQQQQQQPPRHHRQHRRHQPVARSASKQQVRGWVGTTRRNTLIGVEHGIGSGRVLASQLHNLTMESGLLPNVPPAPLLVAQMNNMTAARAKARADLRRKKRAYVASRAVHEARLQLDAFASQRHLEMSSPYGRSVSQR